MDFSSFLTRHGLLLAALACLAALYGATMDNDNMFIWDEAEYASIGKSILMGDGFAISGEPNALRPPILPLSASAAMLVFQGDDDAYLQLAVIGFALLALVLLYAGVSRALDRTAALAASLILGMQPLFWRYTSQFMSEIPFLGLFAGALLFLYLGAYRNSRFFYLSWLCLGLAMLTRYTAVLYAPIAVLFVVAAFLADREAVKPRLFSKAFLISPLVGGAVVLPWLIRQQLAFGDALVGFKIASGQLAAYLPNVSMPPTYYLQGLPEMLSWPGLVLLVLGIVWAVATRNRFALYCLFVAGFLILWFSIYRYKELRLVSSFLPFAAILAAFGLTRLFHWPPVRDRFRNATGPICIVLGVFAANSFLETTDVSERRIAVGYPTFINAMDYLNENARPDAAIMGASTPQIFWYTGRKVIGFPARNELVARLLETEWVVITTYERSQNAYVASLFTKLQPRDLQTGDVAIFGTRQFATIVVRSRILVDRL